MTTTVRLQRAYPNISKRTLFNEGVAATRVLMTNEGIIGGRVSTYLVVVSGYPSYSSNWFTSFKSEGLSGVTWLLLRY